MRSWQIFFSHSVGGLFSLETISFVEQKHFSFMESHGKFFNSLSLVSMIDKTQSTLKYTSEKHRLLFCTYQVLNRPKHSLP
jgi:hypothetical protein